MLILWTNIILLLMDYSKYKTAQWQQKKCEILVRDNFTCQVCGFSSNDDANSSKLLHVHHRYYIKGKDEVWDYPNEALITLCENCHAKEHSFDGKSIQDAYVTNQILRQNASDIISSIEKLDEDISLCNFCKDINLEDICANKDLTLKSYLKNYIYSFDPYISFNPIWIEPGGILIKIRNNNTIPIELMKKLNETYNMGLIDFQLKIDDRMKINEINGGYISSTWGFVQENDLIPPLEILTAMDGCEFDFCAERFYNGTMKSVTIPDDAFKKDPIYYLDKVQELVTKYEKTLIERKSKA